MAMDNEMLFIAKRMASELQCFADAANESGSPKPEVQSLIDEFETIYRESTNWQDLLRDDVELPNFLKKQAD